MPLETDDRLKALLTKGHITAVTVDTNIFDAQGLNLKSKVLKALANLKDVPFQFLLSNTVLREVRGHLEKSMVDSLKAAKEAIGKALYAFDTSNPTRDELLDQITDGRNPADAAAVRLATFIKDSDCEVLEDSSLVDVATLFEAYFEGRPPFSPGKKAEFPDALALNSLDREAVRRQTSFLVVSEDGDWRAFCENSQRLYLVPKIEKALSLINNAPIGLRTPIVAWFAPGQEGRDAVGPAIMRLIDDLDVNVIAYPNSGDVETDAWGPEAHMIDWPEERDIDIIEIDELGEGHFRAVVSLPVLVAIQMIVELTFSVWDSVDKEYIGMGGRTITLERNEDVTVTVTIDFYSVGETGEKIEFIDAELDIKSIDADLGWVDTFDSDDIDYD